MCKKKAQILRSATALSASYTKTSRNIQVYCMIIRWFSRKISGIVIVTMRNLVYNIREYIHYYVCAVKKTVSCNTNP